MEHGHSDELRPRNGQVLIVIVVARISGCDDQTELSNDDQVDHAKEVVSELYDGPVEYLITATVGKGESLERPELEKIRKELENGEADLLIVEDLGRLVRGQEAVNMFGLAVDNGTRAISANDNIDTINSNWEADALAACHDHVAHNTHTSSRIKNKKMNRFKKFGASTPLPIAAYIVPEGAETYDDWQKDPEWTPVIQEGLDLYEQTRNGLFVADMFNRKGFPTGKYCKRKSWDGKMVRRFYKNRILGGKAGRGFRHTIKVYQTGRRISVPNPRGPIWRDYPALAHVDIVQLDALNAVLAVSNKKLGRKPVDGQDSRAGIPKKRTKFLGQHGRCWYCGYYHVWGGNGITDNLMCSASRDWNCWCSVGYSGILATTKVISAITTELYKLEGFDTQFHDLVTAAGNDLPGSIAERLATLKRNESRLSTERENVKNTIKTCGPSNLTSDLLAELHADELRLANERRDLQKLQSKKITLPKSLADLRVLFEQEIQGLALDSYEVVPLLNRLVPEFYVYLVRLCDGRQCYARAQVTLALDALLPDACNVSGLSDLLRKTVTIDLFEPPQRERIRTQAVALNDGVRTHAQIAGLIPERPTDTAVQRALKLHRIMVEQGRTDPYILVENPDEIDSLIRHKNPRYEFKPLPGYQRPSLI